MSVPSKRRDVDIMKLTVGGFDVTIPDKESHPHDFRVKFNGPDETPYAGGVWTVHVTLPANYPFQSPSIGFGNRLFHPNVDERSGSVCLDVINQTWSPMFDLVNIFETFLPQLLRYPNPSDPLNGDAANLLLRDPAAYNKKVEDYVLRYASAGSQSRPPLPAGVVAGKRPFDDMKEPSLGVRKDSAATATTAESTSSVHVQVTGGDDEDGYMSDASELSDL